MPNAPASLPDRLGNGALNGHQHGEEAEAGQDIYEERLMRDHPAIYANLIAGKYQTVTEAAVAAGLKTPRTRLHELKNAWNKSGNSERRDFLAWPAATGAMPGGAPPTTISSGRYLLPATVARINHIRAKRGITTGDIMGEMGFSKLDASLGNALLNGHGLRPTIIAALEKWLTANISV